MQAAMQTRFPVENRNPPPASGENSPGGRRPRNKYTVSADVGREKSAREIESQVIYDAVDKAFNEVFQPAPYFGGVPMSAGAWPQPCFDEGSGGWMGQNPAQASPAATQTMSSPYKNGLRFAPILTPNDTPATRKDKLASSPSRPRGVRKSTPKASPKRKKPVAEDLTVEEVSATEDARGSGVVSSCSHPPVLRQSGH